MDIATTAEHEATPQTATEFHLQEHRLLRAEILELRKDVRFVQRMFAVGVGVYVAWLLSENAAGIGLIKLAAVWAPFFLSFIFGRMAKKSIESIFATAGYLRQIEAVMARPDIKGWERHLSDLRAKRSDAVVSTNMDMMFWAAMHVVTLAFAAAYTALNFSDVQALLAR
ncbi:MAG: hypothetical protein R3C16_08300 [Hyphomonadaceae bacterium]